MMQSDVGASIERNRLIGRLDLPQRQDAVSIGNEHRWIVRPLADDTPPKAIAKELSRAHEVANTQPDMVDTARADSKFVCHSVVPERYVIVSR